VHRAGEEEDAAHVLALIEEAAAVAASRSWPTSPTHDADPSWRRRRPRSAASTSSSTTPQADGGGARGRPRRRAVRGDVPHERSHRSGSSKRRCRTCPRRGDHQYGLAGGLRTGARPPGLCRDKAAIINLSRVSAQLALRGIRVNVVAPGRRGRRRSPTGSRTSR
jgi:NAD(P)-dependent dehydrogenase (short-subunit alcohol dehydrogenase family)